LAFVDLEVLSIAHVPIAVFSAAVLLCAADGAVQAAGEQWRVHACVGHAAAAIQARCCVPIPTGAGELPSFSPWLPVRFLLLVVVRVEPTSWRAAGGTSVVACCVPAHALVGQI
jgi:hypothetical protein